MIHLTPSQLSPEAMTDNSKQLHLILENPRGFALPTAEIPSPLGPNVTLLCIGKWGGGKILCVWTPWGIQVLQEDVLTPGRKGGFAQSHPKLPPLIPVWPTAWIPVTAGGAALTAHEKQAAGPRGARGTAPSFPTCLPPTVWVLCPPRPTPSHLLLNQGRGVNIPTKARDGDGAWVDGKGGPSEACFDPGLCLLRS